MTRLRARDAARRLRDAVNRAADFFRLSDPTFSRALGPALVVSLVLFTRSPYTNYIFDEQEALLANPYVNGDSLGFWQVFERDFWGLPSDRSIGSYRPLPNVIWRAVWQLHARLEHPWVHHVLNVLIHAANAALVSAIALRFGVGRRAAWLSGAVMLCSAVITEAVTGVVGLADVLGGLGVLLAIRALALPMWAMPLAVFGALTIGFFSKESTLCALPITAWCALITAPLLFPERPRRLVRALLALVASVGALVTYTEVRRAFFPVDVPDDLAAPLPEGAGVVRQALTAFLRWFAQPKLPSDPINNPLVDADFAHRVAGGLEVYARGLSQVFFPLTLSGDYSFSAQPIPESVVNPWSVLGALLMIVPLLVALAAFGVALARERRMRAGGQEHREGAGNAHGRTGVEQHSFEVPARSSGVIIPAIVALVCVWVPVAYFPHSNIPVLLPTVRAERFWYLPVIGAAFGLGLWLDAIASERTARFRHAGAVIVCAFLLFQAARARMHALDYSNDLVFWRATARAAPSSAKAHLNYGVMLGARGRLPERLVENGRALEIAPQWPMAHIYYGDTLCRLHRVEEAWPHYAKGFELAPNDRNLIALALQCLWDEEAVEDHRIELIDLAEKYRGSWLAYLGRDIVYHGKKHKGVDPQYRPRGYDEGPKSE